MAEDMPSVFDGLGAARRPGGTGDEIAGGDAMVETRVGLPAGGDQRGVAPVFDVYGRDEAAVDGVAVDEGGNGVWRMRHGAFHAIVIGARRGQSPGRLRAGAGVR